jgi:hypothetical protein
LLCKVFETWMLGLDFGFSCRVKSLESEALDDGFAKA